MATDSSRSLKPVHSAFCGFSVIKSGIISAVVLLGVFFLYLSLPEREPLVLYIPLAIALALNVIYAIWLPIIYKKEEYSLLSNKILARKGGLVSDFEQELLVKNITHVSLHLPFFEHKIYGTGKISIQSAGGKGVEVHMQSIANPQQIYDSILELLRKHGFQAQFTDVVQKDRPHGGAVLLEIIGAALGMVFGAGVFFSPVLVEEKLQVNLPSFGVVALVSLVVIGALMVAVFYYQQQRHTTYFLCQDGVVSETEFFGRWYSVIPMENLSDSILTQGPIARLLGVHNLALSCQGSGSEISFRNVQKGDSWKENLDAILKEKRSQAREESSSAREIGVKSGITGLRQAAGKNLDTEYTATLEMNKKKVIGFPIACLVIGILGTLVGAMVASELNDQSSVVLMVMTILITGGFSLLTLIGIVGSVVGPIFYRGNTYSIKESSFQRKFRLILTNDVEFNTDKITAFVVKRGPLDYFFQTCTLQFWSIGAQHYLNFYSVPYENSLIQRIKDKLGMQEGEQEESVDLPLDYSWESVIKAHLFLYSVLLLVSLSLFVVHPVLTLAALLVVGGSAFLPAIYYRYCFLHLFANHVVCRKGIFFKQTYYVHYNDVKYITLTRFPATHVGALRFEVTGEIVIKTNNGEYTRSNHFALNYIQNIARIYQALDLLFEKKIPVSEVKDLEFHSSRYEVAEIAQAQPSLGNTLFIPAIIVAVFDVMGLGIILAMQSQNPSVVLPGLGALVLLNIVIFPLVILYIKKIHFIIDEEKVSKTWGIVYPKKMSIHFNDIDYIGKQQVFLNKIFKTGNITIHTVGSSKTDLTLRNLACYESFYQKLQESYRDEVES